MELPKFKYHPDPIATDSIKLSDKTCQCCERARGYIYNSTIYSEEEVDRICPWCIADGSAAQKYSGMFSDDYSLQQAGISEAIISEVCEKTPGYNSWQQDEWQHHCDDACEFHGDASKVELKTLSGEALDRFLNQEMVKPEVWLNILEHCQKGGSPSIYKFKCRQCLEVIYTMDFS